MSKKLIVSRPSLQHLAESLDKHTREKFAAQREAKVAKEWGDLSENAEYKASKEKFRQSGKMQQRFTRELKNMEDQGYDIVEPLDWARVTTAPTVVDIGVVARVTQKGFTEDYLLAGAKDTHLPVDKSLAPVPYTSPLGKALMGRSAPSRVDAEIAGEKRTLEIESLRAPTEAELLELFPELASDV